jgi:hypothetical protein
LFVYGASPLFKEFTVSIDDDLRQVLNICKGDLKAALRMVLVANAYYEEEIRRLKNEASTGFARGKVRKPVKAGVKSLKG